MAECTPINHGRYDARPGGSMFHGASNLTINNGIFNAYGANGTDNKKRIADAMALLSSRAEKGAPYDAAAREDVPKCYEHTRVAIIEGIQKWAHSQDPDARPLMWMYGPAGSGKTTIMQTVAEIFDKEECLATSFFFSRLSAARPTTKENFIITLAHQLSQCIPALREPLADALSDPSLLDKSLSKQLDALVTGPLRALQSDQIGHRCIFMVDGLDECEDGAAAQQDVLKLLEHCVRHSSHPIRILIASRYLPHLQAFFSHSNIGVITQTTPLDNDYRAQEDITKFFTAEFRQIREEHPSRCGLPSDWPSLSDIDTLVRRASGQFIYASVVMKFIANYGRHPDESLQTIISLKVDGGAKPYDELDAIYAQVLSTIEPQNVEFILTLMACIVLHRTPFSFADAVQAESTLVVDSLFNLRPGTTDARINTMVPLITKFAPPAKEASLHYSPIPPRRDGLQFSHASFPEYLLDHSRSKNFFLDMRKIHCSLALRSFEIYSLEPSHVSADFSYGAPGTMASITLIGTISHCQAAEWTPELQHAVLTFNIETAFTPTPEWIKKKKAHIDWNVIVLWTLFISWCKYYHRLSSTDAEHILGCLRNMIQSMCSKLPSSHNIDMKVIAILLTLYRSIDIRNCWDKLYGHLGHREGEALMEYDHKSLIARNDNVCEASLIWLCKTLAPDLEMDGLFFADGNLYASLALLCLQPRPYRPSEKKTGVRSISTVGVGWEKNIVNILSKSAPSEELAMFIKQNFLQGKGIPNPQDRNDRQELVTAMIIYLFECGVPFMSEHHHAPDFDPHNQVCYICLLFDPYKAECFEVELSRDPSGVSRVRLPGTTQGDLPAVANHVHFRIPGLPLIWLRIWILWLTDTMTRFFPVAT